MGEEFCRNLERQYNRAVESTKLQMKDVSSENVSDVIGEERCSICRDTSSLVVSWDKPRAGIVFGSDDCVCAVPGTHAVKREGRPPGARHRSLYGVGARVTLRTFVSFAFEEGLVAEHGTNFVGVVQRFVFEPKNRLSIDEGLVAQAAVLSQPP